MGLKPSGRMLDAGCGPLRAGVHFIHYLNRGKYWGIDSNADFCGVAKGIVAQDSRLRRKAPHLKHLEKFDFAKLRSKFDYVLAFSVLNHCHPVARAAFFKNAGRVTAAAFGVTRPLAASATPIAHTTAITATARTIRLDPSFMLCPSFAYPEVSMVCSPEG